MLSAFLYASSAAVQKGIGFAAFLVLANSLSVERYAQFGLMFALQTGIAGLTGAGIVETVIGLLRESRAARMTNGLFAAGNSVFAIQALICVALVASIAIFVSGLLNVPRASLFVIAASGIVSAFATLQSQWTRLEERHALSTAFGFFPPLAGWIAGFMCFLPLGTPEAFFVGMLLGTTISMVAFRASGRGYYALASDAASIRRIIASLLPFVVVVFVMWIGGYGNTYLIDAIFTPTEVARFVFLYTVAAVMQIVATSLNQVWIPRFVRIIDSASPDEIDRRSRAFFLVQGVALGLTGAALLVLLPLATGFFGGRLSAYHDMNVQLFFLLAAYAALIPWYYSQNYFSVHARGQLLLRTTLLSSVAGVGVWIVLMLVLGEMGIYLGFFVFNLLRAIAVAWRARLEWRVALRLEAVAVTLIIQAGGFLLAALLV
jgi:O-antigen/teichoic acid export membrane protein